jgi:hypothetical protein
MSKIPSFRNDRSCAELILNGSRAMRFCSAAAEEKLKDSTDNAKKKIKIERIMVNFNSFRALSLLQFLSVVRSL